MSGIPAVHHSLRHIDPGASYVRPVVHISPSANRSAVDTHSHFEFRMMSQRFAHLQRAPDRRIGCARKSQRHSISSWQANQLSGSFRDAERVSVSNDLIELGQKVMLFVDEQF